MKNIKIGASEAENRFKIYSKSQEKSESIRKMISDLVDIEDIMRPPFNKLKTVHFDRIYINKNYY